MLHYDPQHVSSSTLIILRRKFANVFTAAFNKHIWIHFTNQSNFTSLLFYLNIVLTIQQTSFY